MDQNAFYLTSHGITLHGSPTRIKQMWFFLDDEREPPTVTHHEWAIFRTGEAMLRQIDFSGVLPDGISFDHDLGPNVMSGHDVAKQLIEWFLDGNLDVPDHFEYRTHSQNPIGESHIIKTMDDLIALSRKKH